MKKIVYILLFLGILISSCSDRVGKSQAEQVFRKCEGADFDDVFEVLRRGILKNTIKKKVINDIQFSGVPMTNDEIQYEYSEYYTISPGSLADYHYETIGTIYKEIIKGEDPNYTFMSGSEKLQLYNEKAACYTIVLLEHAERNGTQVAEEEDDRPSLIWRVINNGLIPLLVFLIALVWLALQYMNRSNPQQNNAEIFETVRKNVSNPSGIFQGIKNIIGEKQSNMEQSFTDPQFKESLKKEILADLIKNTGARDFNATRGMMERIINILDGTPHRKTEAQDQFEAYLVNFFKTKFKLSPDPNGAGKGLSETELNAIEAGIKKQIQAQLISDYIPKSEVQNGYYSKEDIDQLLEALKVKEEKGTDEPSGDEATLSQKMEALLQSYDFTENESLNTLIIDGSKITTNDLENAFMKYLLENENNIVIKTVVDKASEKVEENTSKKGEIEEGDSAQSVQMDRITALSQKVEELEQKLRKLSAKNQNTDPNDPEEKKDEAEQQQDEIVEDLQYKNKRLEKENKRLLKALESKQKQDQKTKRSTEEQRYTRSTGASRTSRIPEKNTMEPSGSHHQKNPGALSEAEYPDTFYSPAPNDDIFYAQHFAANLVPKLTFYRIRVNKDGQTAVYYLDSTNRENIQAALNLRDRNITVGMDIIGETENKSGILWQSYGTLIKEDNNWVIKERGQVKFK